MYSARLPFFVLVVLYAGFVSFVLLTGKELPERIATHFGTAGNPNGWMSRDSHVRYMLTFGLLLPVTVSAVCYCIRFLPASLVNLPRREYWLAPERRASTLGYLFRQSLWLGSLVVCFVAGSHWMVVEANLRKPPQLSTWLLALVAGGFVIGLVCWIGLLLRRFMARPG